MGNPFQILTLPITSHHLRFPPAHLVPLTLRLLASQSRGRKSHITLGLIQGGKGPWVTLSGDGGDGGDGERHPSPARAEVHIPAVCPE